MQLAMWALALLLGALLPRPCEAHGLGSAGHLPRADGELLRANSTARGASHVHAALQRLRPVVQRSPAPAERSAPPRAAQPVVAAPVEAAHALLRGNLVTTLRGNQTATGSGGTSRGKPDPKRLEAMKKVYTLQFVGINPNGIEPRDPMARESNRCLTSIKEDTALGVGLSWSACPHYTETDKFGIPMSETKQPKPEQLFQFMENGRIRHFQTGKCLRRVQCGGARKPKKNNREPPYLYDLGDCVDMGVARYEMWSSRANRADIAMRSGSPVNGIVGACKMCGPYLLYQVCRGPCNEPDPPDGWTRDTSQLIRKKKKSQEPLTYKMMSPYYPGLCGSFMRDDEEIPSWWYFHKYDPPAQPKK